MFLADLLCWRHTLQEILLSEKLKYGVNICSTLGDIQLNTVAHLSTTQLEVVAHGAGGGIFFGSLVDHKVGVTTHERPKEHLPYLFSPVRGKRWNMQADMNAR